MVGDEKAAPENPEQTLEQTEQAPESVEATQEPAEEDLAQELADTRQGAQQDVEGVASTHGELATKVGELGSEVSVEEEGQLGQIDAGAVEAEGRLSEVSEDIENPEVIAELAEKISAEQEKAREDFGNLIEAVSDRYDGMNPDMKRTFIEHNSEILDAVVELGVKKELTSEELKLVEMAAIIHDMTKAEPDPEGIGNYTLANHGESAAREVDNLITDEMLETVGVDTSDGQAVQTAKDTIVAAVREHMGPHPGFMDGILAGVNAQIEAKNQKLAEGQEPIPLVEHPVAQGKVSETLLAADMGSLAGQAGREKVMAIRSNVQFFVGQDRATVADYKSFGVDLNQGEAALLSGFDSAADAHDMLTDTSDRQRTQNLIDQSKEEGYSFINPDSQEGEQATWAEATSKRIDFLPQWIEAETARIEGGEYAEGEEVEAAQQRLESGEKNLERSQQEMAVYELNH